MSGHEDHSALPPTRVEGRGQTYVSQLEGEVHELTKALTGLTCGGSEFFNRKGERYVADIPACVGYVQRLRTDAHEGRVREIRARKAAEVVSKALYEALAELTSAADEYESDVASWRGNNNRLLSALTAATAALSLAHPPKGEEL